MPIRHRLPLSLCPKRRVPSSFSLCNGPSMPRRAPSRMHFFLMDRHINKFSHVRRRKIGLKSRSREIKNIIFGYNYLSTHRILDTITCQLTVFWIQLPKNSLFWGIQLSKAGTQSAEYLEAGWGSKMGGHRSANGADLDEYLSLTTLTSVWSLLSSFRK